MLTQLKAAVLIKEDIAFRDGVCLNVITKWKKKKIKLPRNFHFIEQFVLLSSQDSTNWLEPEYKVKWEVLHKSENRDNMSESIEKQILWSCSNISLITAIAAHR